MRSVPLFVKFRAIITVLAVTFGLSMASKAESLVVISAKVAHLSGSARYTVDGVSRSDLKTGDSIKPGYTIQTAERSSVDIAFGHSLPSRLPVQNTLIHLFPDSALEFEKLDIKGRRILRTFFWGKQTNEIRLNLKTGRILGTVQKEPPIADYEVRFADHIVRIPFGGYVLDAAGKVYVLIGSAVVSDKAGMVVKTVGARREFDLVTGKIEDIPPSDNMYDMVSGPCMEIPTPISTSHRGPGLGGALRVF
jgi:hypothetical protein